jgi:hypothetical protein
MTEYAHLRSTLSQIQVCPLDHGRGIQKQDKKPLMNKIETSSVWR